MRANRTFGSEGGEAKAFPTPIMSALWNAQTIGNLAPLSPSIQVAWVARMNRAMTRGGKVRARIASYVRQVL